MPGFSWGRLRLVFGEVSARLRLRAGRWLPGPTVDGLLPGGEGWSSGRGLPGRWLGASSAGRGVFRAGSAGAVPWGERCRSVGLPGGGRKAAVALEDAGWSFSVRRSFSGVGNLNLNLNLSLSLGRACPGPSQDLGRACPGPPGLKSPDKKCRGWCAGRSTPSGCRGSRRLRWSRCGTDSRRGLRGCKGG